MGGFSASRTQSYSKLPEIDRSSLKKFSLFRGGGGSFSASWTQSYSKLPEMDRSSLTNISLFRGKGELFCQPNPKLLKLPEMDRSSLKKFPMGGFLPAKPKVTQNCLKWIDPFSEIVPCLGGCFSTSWTQSYSKLLEVDRSSLYKHKHTIT